MNSEMFKELLNLGIDCFIDLTNHKDIHRKFPYRRELFRVRREMRRTVEIKTLPLPVRTAPDQAQIRRIMRTIQRSLNARKHIYIHAGYNLEGCTPLVLACLLMQRGLPGKDALAEVNAFWSKTLQFLVRTSLSEAQEQFILKWQGCRV
jgi:hypothetical protein